MDCCLCDGYPTFETRALHKEHFLTHHFLDKIELSISYIDTYDKLISMRQNLGINVEVGVCKAEKIKKEDPNKETEMATASVDHQEEEREHCAFCAEGFLAKDYLSHMALGHFREAFASEVTQNFKCKRCIFRGDDEDDLILHLAVYHQLLNNIIACHSDSTPNAASPLLPVSLDLSSFVFKAPFGIQCHNFTCQLCLYTTSNQSDLTVHLMRHLKEISKKILPQAEPWICPTCFYESSSYYTMLR